MHIQYHIITKINEVPTLKPLPSVATSQDVVMSHASDVEVTRLSSPIEKEWFR